MDEVTQIEIETVRVVKNPQLRIFLPINEDMEPFISFQEMCQHCDGRGRAFDGKHCNKCVSGTVTTPIDPESIGADLVEQVGEEWTSKVREALCKIAHPIQCAGCQKLLTEGKGTSWCSSKCVCLGAVWCIVCWNLHIDRKGEAL